jgi:transposase
MGKKVNYYYQQYQKPELKKAFPEFRDIHSQVLQDVAGRVDRAYQNFFRRIEEKRRESNRQQDFRSSSPDNATARLRTCSPVLMFWKTAI